jgi:hypothetical protein
MPLIGNFPVFEIALFCLSVVLQADKTGVNAVEPAAIKPALPRKCRKLLLF